MSILGIAITTILGLLGIAAIIIGFFGVGILINEIADLVIGVLLVIYFVIRGFSVTRHMQLFLALIAVEGVEELTGGFAPAWTFDIYNAKRIATNEKAAQEAEEIQNEIVAETAQQPLNNDGVRSPRLAPTTGTGSAQSNTLTRNINLAPNNINGVRRAGSGNSTGNTGTSTPSNTGSTREEASTHVAEEEGELVVK